jgi:hypothetical protein
VKVLTVAEATLGESLRCCSANDEARMEALAGSQ